MRGLDFHPCGAVARHPGPSPVQVHVNVQLSRNENVNEKQNYLDYFFYPSSTRKGYELEENVVHLFLFVFSLSFLFSHI